MGFVYWKIEGILWKYCEPWKYCRLRYRNIEGAVMGILLSLLWKYLGSCYGNIVGSVFVCVEVLRPSQPNRVMSSAVSLPNHTFTGQA